MSQENIYSQTSNLSQNDIGQQTLEDIKNRSEKIIKQKCKDDFKLNNLQKDHQDFQKLIDEKNRQIANAAKDSQYLENAFGQMEISRGSVKSDVHMIVKSVTEYDGVFIDMKQAIKAIINEFKQNEDVIESCSKQVQNNAVRNRIQEKLKDLKHKRKLLQDLLEATVKYEEDRNKNNDYSIAKIENLDKDEQQCIIELHILENKNEELKTNLVEITKLKEDLQSDLNKKQEEYDAAQQKYEADTINNAKQVEELEATFNGQREKISNLEKNLEVITAERKKQISAKEEAEIEILCLEKNINELHNNLEKHKEEVLTYQKMIEDESIESSQVIHESEKQLQNLDEILCNLKTSNEQIENSIINDKKILDDLKQQENTKKEDINSIQNEIKEIMKNVQDSELKYKEVIDECNGEINEFQAEKQNLLDKKEELLKEKDNICQMISDLQLKKNNYINESTNIETKQNNFINNINKEIENSKNVLRVLKEDCEISKNSFIIQFQEISLKFKDRKNEILDNTNEYKERIESAERKAEEQFKIEKNKCLEEQTKMELQISEFNAAIEYVQGELKNIVNQINIVNKLQEKTPLKPEIKQPQIKNKKVEIENNTEKMFEWTTDEEDYKKSQKLKLTQSQIPKVDKPSMKIPKKVEMSQKKKETAKQSIKKIIIDKISSTDSEFDWIQPLSKLCSRKTK